MNSNVDAVGLLCLDGTGDKEADLTGEKGFLILLRHLGLQGALDREEAAVLPGHEDNHVYICSMGKMCTEKNQCTYWNIIPFQLLLYKLQNVIM